MEQSPLYVSPRARKAREFPPAVEVLWLSPTRARHLLSSYVYHANGKTYGASAGRPRLHGIRSLLQCRVQVLPRRDPDRYTHLCVVQESTLPSPFQLDTGCALAGVF